MKKIEFAPGCFDQFEGTQEELDELIATITKIAQSGQLEQQGIPLTQEELEEFDKKIQEWNKGRQGQLN